jgi:8-oxo-dGTP pyrophosphatase MutT (NUDIX family)
MFPCSTDPQTLRIHLREVFAAAPEAVRMERLAAVPGRRPDRLEGERSGRRTRFAAVLLALVPDAATDAWHAVLMERTPHEGVHGGQISIPGGEVEPSDSSRWMTAQREFEEEMGVRVRESDVVGQLTRLYIPPSGFEVEAFVAVLDEEPVWHPDRKEVAAVLRWVLHPEPELMAMREGAMRVPGYPCEGRVIWGATAILLTELLAVMRWGRGTM